MQQDENPQSNESILLLITINIFTITKLKGVIGSFQICAKFVNS